LVFIAVNTVCTRISC